MKNFSIKSIFKIIFIIFSSKILLQTLFLRLRLQTFEHKNMDSQSRHRKTAAGFVGGSWEQITYGDQQQHSSEEIFRSCTVHYGLSNLSSLSILYPFLKIFLINIKCVTGDRERCSHIRNK